jgi:hypothetical protein
MTPRGELQIDPGQLGTESFGRELELVVPFTDPALAAALMRRATALTAGLDAHIQLVAVHTVPFPADFHCTAFAHAFLVDQLTDLATACPLPVNPQVVLARSRSDGFRFALRPESTVLIASRRALWRTSEERLARMLADDGHKVVLIHISGSDLHA